MAELTYSEGDIRYNIGMQVMEYYSYGSWSNVPTPIEVIDNQLELQQVKKQVEWMSNQLTALQEDLELEKEYEELRAVGNYYRKIKEKVKTFERLKKDYE